MSSMTMTRIPSCRKVTLHTEEVLQRIHALRDRRQRSKSNSNAGVKVNSFRYRKRAATASPPVSCLVRHVRPYAVSEAVTSLPPRNLATPVAWRLPNEAVNISMDDTTA